MRALGERALLPAAQDHPVRRDVRDELQQQRLEDSEGALDTVRAEKAAMERRMVDLKEKTLQQLLLVN